MTNIPIAKKCILLKERIDENNKDAIEDIAKRVSLTEKELEELNKNNFWRANIENTNDYKVIK